MPAQRHLRMWWTRPTHPDCPYAWRTFPHSSVRCGPPSHALQGSYRPSTPQFHRPQPQPQPYAHALPQPLQECPTLSGYAPPLLDGPSTHPTHMPKAPRHVPHADDLPCTQTAPHGPRGPPQNVPRPVDAPHARSTCRRPPWTRPPCRPPPRPLTMCHSAPAQPSDTPSPCMTCCRPIQHAPNPSTPPCLLMDPQANPTLPDVSHDTHRCPMTSRMTRIHRDAPMASQASS